MENFNISWEFVLLLAGFAVFVFFISGIQNRIGFKYTKKRREYLNMEAAKQRELHKGLNVVHSKDTFFAFYGIKFKLNPEDEAELDACESGTDRRCIKAKTAGLNTDSGSATAGQDYFLYIGINLGAINLLDKLYLKVENLESVITSTEERLGKAGFAEKPELHLQMSCDY